MNPMLKKLVDQEFMTEAHANYLEEAVMKKESVIISGHKGFGILPLMATLGTIAKGNFKIKQVKGPDDIVDKTDEYYLVADLKLTDEFDATAYAKLVADTMAIPNASMITIKDPDHPYSLLKLLGDVYKQTGDTSKVYQVVECAKVDGEKRLVKITRIALNESGKPVKVDFKG